MFITRTIFWLGVVVLLLPTGQSSEAEGSAKENSASTITPGAAFNAATSTVSDLSAFCTRNPDVCETGNAAWNTMRQKARYGVKMIVDWANEDETPPGTVETGNVKVEPKKDKQLITGSSAQYFDKAIRLSENTQPVNAPAANSGNTSQVSPSQNTLKIQDLIPTWGGPLATKERA